MSPAFGSLTRSIPRRLMILPSERRADPFAHPWKWPKPASGGKRHRPNPLPPREGPEPFHPGPEPHPEPSAGKPKLRLSNPRWIEARGEYGERAVACVDAEAPPTAA